MQIINGAEAQQVSGGYYYDVYYYDEYYYRDPVDDLVHGMIAGGLIGLLIAPMGHGQHIEYMISGAIVGAVIGIL